MPHWLIYSRNNGPITISKFLPANNRLVTVKSISLTPVSCDDSPDIMLVLIRDGEAFNLASRRNGVVRRSDSNLIAATFLDGQYHIYGRTDGLKNRDRIELQPFV